MTQTFSTVSRLKKLISEASVSDLQNHLRLTVTDDKENEVGFLRPFSPFDETDERVIESLTVWRNNALDTFADQTPATIESTRLWLTQKVNHNSHRILFWVEDNHGYKLGHLGINWREDVGRLELDAVLRGLSGSPGLMTMAIRALLTWCWTELITDCVWLRVISTNSRAISLYEKLGFERSTEEQVTLNIFNDSGLSETYSGSYINMFLDLSLMPARDEILTAGPSIGMLERLYVGDAVASGWNYKHSEYLNRFESAFAQLVGSKHAIATSSCTGALHLALLALEIGPGDEVIVPEITWVATASAVAYIGAKPVFCPVDNDSWTLSTQAFESLITSKTRAVIPVHLYGFPANMAEILEIARRHNLRVLEDAAPAIGATYAGKKVGTFGDFGAFSFQGAKLLVTGEGGMLVTDDTGLYERARQINDHGRTPGTFSIEFVGRKYKMPNHVAALGLAQLERINENIEAKKRVNHWYRTELAGVHGIHFQTELNNSESIFWMSSIFLEPSIFGEGAAPKLASFLKLHRVDTRPIFPPLSSLDIWGYKPEVTDSFASIIHAQSLNLPSGALLRRSEARLVSSLIREWVASCLS